MSAALIFLALCQASALDPSTARAREIAWRAAGVAPARERSNEQRMRALGLFDVAWRTDASSRAAFLRIPGTEPFFGAPVATADSDGYVAWRNAIAPLSWAGVEPLLSLVQVEDSGTARGAVRLAPPSTTGNSALATRVARISELSSGCAMEYEFSLPVELPPEGVELSFAWDLHNPIEVELLRLSPSLSGVSLPAIAIELVEPNAAVRIEPRVLALFEDSGQPTSVQVTPRTRTSSSLRSLTFPECVAVRSISDDGGGWRIEFIAQPLALAFHECGPARVDVLVGDDPQPYSRYLRIEHGCQPRDTDGARILSGTFVPGERAEIRSDGHVVLLCMPDRLSCAPSLLESLGLRRIEQVQVASSRGVFDARLSTADGAFRIAGRSIDAAVVHADAWTAACRR